MDTKLNSLFWGFAGGGIVPGLTMIYRYFYWTHPQNSTRYAEKMDKVLINRITDKDRVNEIVLGI